ncbi:hypothetical protein [Pyxidicoccus sp. MSG2]|uniref:bestrophin-like domain n=1 Tax=Pyxidicoccus sp. MSG2 TaxID=2996790 RepID=UPI00226F0544|nr:hypothetical protein [Pyxidicoccus sp. MSG2]MCY1020080.1 hypothetical protein [Pyxidicoccus sp. MSG2]
MLLQFLLELPLLLLGGVLFPAMLLTVEAGFRLGRRVARASAERESIELGSVESAVLALLGLLIAFTFSMAVARYDERRSLVVEEANALGTAWLRCDLLPEPRRTVAREQLRAYIEARVQQLDEEKALTTTPQMKQWLDALWRQVADASMQESRAETTALAVQAVNAVIDLGAARSAADVNHIPIPVFKLLVIFTLVALLMMGYARGLRGIRVFSLMAMLCVLLSLVLLLIVDLDRPHRGTIRIRGMPLRELLTDIQQAGS